MGRLESEELSPERIRYRLTRLQRLLPMLPGSVIMTVFLVLIWLDGGPVGPPLAVVVLPFVLLIASRPFGVTLTQSAAVVHNLTRRTIPWANVQAIQIESYLGIRTVVIYEAGGRRTRLRAPITGFLSWDHTFGEKFHTIGGWWLDHRGPDWAPVAPPEASWGDPPAPGGNPFAPPA
ncbi:hypothetical protein [Streptomyces sp. NPDC000880]